jgi:sarcosine oxidase / L-pipecolate oxidase
MNRDTGGAYDVVVVGGGLMGSSAAYYASVAGQRVLLLEQFSLLHAKGSSHGSSRIFRVAYTDATYTKMCIDSLAMWREIEEKAGVKLLEMTGELDFVEHSHSAQLDEVAKVLGSHAQPHEVLTGAQVNARFPGFALPADSHAVFSQNAGVLNPTLAMKTLQQLAVARGAEIRDNSPVVSVTCDDEQQSEGLFAVVLADGSVARGKQCIVTAGPWTKKLLGVQSGVKTEIAINPIATFGTYWKCKPASEQLYTPARFPVFISYGEPSVYGLPMEDPAHGVKVCLHTGPSVDPDTRQAIVAQSEEDVHKVQHFLGKFMPQVDASAISKVDLCMYSMTEDEDFILDFVDAPPTANSTSSTPKQLVVGAGFSGHGAKMTPVIGKILADLAVHGKATYPLEKFALARFSSS